MSVERTVGRLVAAVAVGLASIASCAGAAPATPTAQPSPPGSAPPDVVVEPLGPVGEDLAAKRGDTGKAGKGPADAGAEDAGAPRCPYGALEDPHRGFVRCLSPDERDAGWLPPPPQREPVADAKPKPDAPATKAALPLVEVGAPRFENGQVPRAEKMLNGAAADIAKCIADNGGLSGAAGSLKIQFLVRARGRAEGVEVSGVKGVSAEAAQCVRLLLKNKAVGAPSADPVGVTVTLTLKPQK